MNFNNNSDNFTRKTFALMSWKFRMHKFRIKLIPIFMFIRAQFPYNNLVRKKGRNYENELNYLPALPVLK